MKVDSEIKRYVLILVYNKKFITLQAYTQRKSCILREIKLKESKNLRSKFHYTTGPYLQIA